MMRVLLWSLLLAALATLPAGAAEKPAFLMGDYNSELRAGERAEHKHRRKEDATAERIAARVRTALEVAADGKAEGVVVYCLNKRAGSEDFEALKALYREFAAADR